MYIHIFVFHRRRGLVSKRVSSAGVRSSATIPCHVVRKAVAPVRASSKEVVTGVVFEPFEAVQGELAVVDKAPVSESYARVDYTPECEAAVNEQVWGITDLFQIAV